MRKLLGSTIFGGITVLSLLVGPAQATVVYSDSGTIGSDSVSATASFTISVYQLSIVLQNTSPHNTGETPTSTLSGIAFLLNGASPVLTPITAVSPGAIFHTAACGAHPCSGTNVNVGGEWGYQANFSSGLLSHTEAIGSAGYITTGLSGNLGNFGGPNLQNPVSLDGINFAILSNNAGPLNGGLSSVALIKDTIDLTLNGVSGLLESKISGVTFLYGTSPDVTVVGRCTSGCDAPSVPEPATLALVGGGLAMLGFWRRRAAI